MHDDAQGEKKCFAVAQIVSRWWCSSVSSSTLVSIHPTEPGHGANLVRESQLKPVSEHSFSDEAAVVRAAGHQPKEMAIFFQFAELVAWPHRSQRRRFKRVTRPATVDSG